MSNLISFDDEKAEENPLGTVLIYFMIFYQDKSN